MKTLIFIAHLVSCFANSNEATTEAMQSTFLRSEDTHQRSMATISQQMTASKAMEFLKEKNSTTASLIESATAVLGKKLRKQPKGYGGLTGARNLLNDMIFESMTKYDQEIAKCTEYYSKQCAAMEACRGQIAASNYIAANSRMLILDSQAVINKCEVDIPARELELKQHL